MPRFSVAAVLLRPVDWVRGDRFGRAAVWVAAAACLLLAFLVYGPSLDDYFAWDDFWYLRAVRAHNLATVAVRAVTFPHGGFRNEVTPFWRPLIDLYFYAARPLGLHAEPYHAVNIIIHGAVGALAVIFVWRLTRSATSGAITGFLFTVAPTYDFAVTWISQVSELLGAALILGALLSYHVYLTADRANRLYPAITTCLVMIALLTKESSVIVALLLPALAVFLSAGERRRTWPEIGRTLAPTIILGVAFGVAMQLHQLTDPGAVYRGAGLHTPTDFWRFLTWLVFPYHYGSAPAARDAAAVIFLGAGGAMILLRRPALGFLFAWTIVAMLPFMSLRLIELRHTYLACLPFTAFVVSCSVAAVRALPRPAALAAAMLLAVAVGAALVVTPMRTRDQQAYFHQQAAGYELMVESVRSLCGTLSPDSYVYVVNPPYRDILGSFHTSAALNLYYDRLYVGVAHQDLAPAEAPVLPAAAASFKEKCVIRYVAGSDLYAKVEQSSSTGSPR